MYVGINVNEASIVIIVIIALLNNSFMLIMMMISIIIIKVIYIDFYANTTEICLYVCNIIYL